jgi:spore maturation protein CgeB
MGDPGKNLNLRFLPGASNKAFDYLAAGLALIVPDRIEWQQMYVEPGYALACSPNDPASLASVLHWCLEHSDKLRAMGERGRQRILSEWNYDQQFQPVLEYIEHFTPVRGAK